MIGISFENVSPPGSREKVELSVSCKARTVPRAWNNAEGVLITKKTARERAEVSERQAKRGESGVCAARTTESDWKKSYPAARKPAMARQLA
jgi:hypothetical protein